MTIYFAAIRRDSVSLLGFSFRSHDRDISCANFQVCRQKYPYVCFSSHFFLLVFLAFLYLFMLPQLHLAVAINQSSVFII